MAKQSWDTWTTIPSSTNAHAFIGNNEVGHTFRFNPDTVNWSYQENIASVDTIGGRVTQLLSIQLTGLTINGRAGNRGELQRISTNLKTIMGYHTNSLNPVHFKVPSKRWDFIGYVIDVSQLGWEIASTSYPYQIQFAVEDDLTGIKTKQISEQVINNLQKDIGYDAGHHGGDAQEFYAIIETLGTAGTGTAPDGSSEVNVPGNASEPAKAWIEALNSNFTWTNMGICDCRSTNNGLGGGTPSQHSYCNAVDAGGSKDTMQAIADFAVENANKYKIHTIIYNHQSHGRTGGWNNYSCSGATGCHEDHVHVDFDPQGSGQCTT